MIRSGKVKAHPSAHIKQRAAKMKAWLFRHYDDFERVVQIKVKPGEKGKAVRIVEFKKVEGDVEIRCWDSKSLVACEANRFSLLCSHAVAAIDVLIETGGKD